MRRNASFPVLSHTTKVFFAIYTKDLTDSKCTRGHVVCRIKIRFPHTIISLQQAVNELVKRIGIIGRQVGPDLYLFDAAFGCFCSRSWTRKAKIPSFLTQFFSLTLD